MTRARVDLPQPDSPITPTVWPRCTETLTVAEHPHGRGALSVTGVDVAHLQRGRFAPVLVQRLVALSGGGRWAHGGHQPPGVVVARAG